MSDYIDRDDAIKAMLTRYWDGKETLREIMNSVPAADVAPVKRGKWEPLSETQENSRNSLAMYRCSVCGRRSLQHRMGDNYCSQCGAKMEQSKGFICYPFYGDNA